MNARTSAFVVCRLLSLFVLANNAAIALVQAVASALITNRTNLILSLAWLGLDVVGSAILWFGAGWISDRLVKGLPERPGPGIDVNGAKVAAVAIVGGLFILTAFQDFSQLLRLYLRHDPVLYQGVLQQLVISILFLLISGAAIIGWAGAIVDRLTRLWRWANAPFIDGGAA